jgi:prophage tail gpP-like protein
MSFGAIPFAESTLAGSTTGLAPAGGGGGGEPETPTVVLAPFTVEISGVAVKPMEDSVSIDTELGRQGTASFTLVNPYILVRLGATVKIKFYDDTIFSGSIDRITEDADLVQAVTTLRIECLDHAQLLVRKKVKRSFTNVTVEQIASALIEFELLNDGITLGTVDALPVIPSIDADAVSAYDLLNDAAVSVGAIFTIDHEKRVHFTRQSIVPLPTVLDGAAIESCQRSTDRETYRNKEIVTVTGTPGPGGQAISVTLESNNGSQVSAQSVIEETSGLYTGMSAITHPTANDIVSLTRLAFSYGRTLLAVQGSFRDTLRVETRRSGFRVGQMVTVSLAQRGIQGNWVLQRVAMRDVGGLWMRSDLEFSVSSLQRRAQALWLDVVRKGSVVTLPPTAITTNVQTYSTPGAYQFEVPAGIFLLQVSCFGAGGGGGGGAVSTFGSLPQQRATGGQGGRGGLAVTVIGVNPGNIISVTVPSGGGGGAYASQLNNGIIAVGANGGWGGDAVVRSGSSTLVVAYGGQGGQGAVANAYNGLSITYQKMPDAGGVGNAVTVGGGAHQGAGGNGSPLQNGVAGGNGSIILEW